MKVPRVIFFACNGAENLRPKCRLFLNPTPGNSSSCKRHFHNLDMRLKLFFKAYWGHRVPGGALCVSQQSSPMFNS